MSGLHCQFHRKQLPQDFPELSVKTDLQELGHILNKRKIKKSWIGKESRCTLTCQVERKNKIKTFRHVDPEAMSPTKEPRHIIIMHFIWVSRYLAWKYWLGTLFLRLQLETGQPFYVVIRAMWRISRLQCKGSTFISQLSLDPECWSGPGNQTLDHPLSNQALYPLS